jgi:acyl-coenzyme A thioesterase PaaI-like protein
VTRVTRAASMTAAADLTAHAAGNMTDRPDSCVVIADTSVARDRRARGLDVRIHSSRSR